MDESIINESINKKQITNDSITNTTELPKLITASQLSPKLSTFKTFLLTFASLIPIVNFGILLYILLSGKPTINPNYRSIVIVTSIASYILHLLIIAGGLLGISVYVGGLLQ